MSEHDVLFGFRLRCSRSRPARQRVRGLPADGVNRSMYYRLKKRVDRWGLEALRVRERRRPRMPNELGPHIEQRIIAFSLADPGYGPRRISAELEREKWGGLRISEHGVWRVLRRDGSNTRAGRFALIAGYAARYERRPPEPRRIAAERPGELVGLDCSFIGRLSGTKGSVWQYTAIDLASGFAWGSCTPAPRIQEHATAGRSSTGWPGSSPRRAGGSKRRSATTARSSARASSPTAWPSSVSSTAASAPAARPPTATSSGSSRRSSRSAGGRSLVPELSALERDLESYLLTYNHDRAHTGWRTQGRIPADIV